MDKKTLTKIGISAIAAMPLFAFAAVNDLTGTPVGDWFNAVRGILNAVIPILMVFATVVFLWGIISYITAAGDEKKSANAKQYITYGIIGLFFMVAIWGIVKAIVTTFGVGGVGIQTIPGNL